MTEVYIAIISGVLSLLGVIITVVAGQSKTRQEMKSQTDLMLYRIEQLEIKQDKHNTLIERMYAVEDKVNVMAEKIRNIEEL